MHELSIAQSLVEVAVEQLATAGWDAQKERIGSVMVRIGAMSGVVAEALSMAFGMAAVGTALEGAALQIESVDVAVWCPECSQERILTDTQQLRCPVCNARTPRIVRGMELELVSIEVVDAAPNPGSTSAHS